MWYFVGLADMKTAWSSLVRRLIVSQKMLVQIQSRS